MSSRGALDARATLDEVLGERWLRASEQRWRSIFENSAIGITMTDAEGRFVLANRAYQELVGYTEDELWGMTFFEITYEEDRDRGRELGRALHAGTLREAQVEKRYRRKDGRLIWVRVTSSIVPAANGSPPLRMAVVEDITNRKRAEAELSASLEQARSLAASLMHAQDEERRRIARELHETTAQDLAALKMNLAALEKSGARLNRKTRALLAESAVLADEAMHEIRTLSYLLHPPFLDEVGLVAAVRWYAMGFAKRSGIAVTLELPEDFGRLPEDVQTALFRVVQESLINIHRHAASATAAIRFRANGAALVLEVQDHGRGLPSDAAEGGAGAARPLGVGVAGMRERMQQLGGRLEIESSRAGTTVRAILPAPGAAS